MFPSMNLPASVVSDSALSFSLMSPSLVLAVALAFGVVAFGVAAVTTVRRLRWGAAARRVVGATRAPARAG